MTKEDVLLPQDAQAVDPSKLSALTPEVVSFGAARERRRQDGFHAGGPQWVMGSVVWRVEWELREEAWWSIPAIKRAPRLEGVP